MLVTAVAATLVVLVVLYVQFLWTHRRLIREAEKLPSYFRRWPIIGSILQTCGYERMSRTIMTLCKPHISQGGISNACVLWAGPMPLFVINDAQDINKLNSLYVGQGDVMENITRVFTPRPGLLLATVDKWKVTRKCLNPVFHPRNCEMLMPVFNENSQELVSQLSRHVGKEALNIMEHTTQMAMKTVLYLIFGPAVKFEVESSSFKRMKRSLDIVSECLAVRLANIILQSDIIFRLIYRNEIKEVKESIGDVFAAIQKCKESNEENTEFITAEYAYRSIMDNHHNITIEDFFGEVATITGTGTDTLSNSVSFAILALAQYPDIQEKLYNEIMSEVGREENLTVKDLHRLIYLDQVFKEVLRWFAIAPLTTKEVLKDTELSTCTVPAGTTVYLNLAALHMNPNIYADPSKFNPEHFSPSVKIDKGNFIPFTSGPRSCIGKRYAESSFKVVMVHLVREFKFTTHMDMTKLKMKFAISLKPTEGVYVALHRRDR